MISANIGQFSPLCLSWLCNRQLLSVTIDSREKLSSKTIGVDAPVVGPEEGMVEIVILLLMLAVLLDIAALKWGVNSVDDIDSPEWERRQRWYGFH